MLYPFNLIATSREAGPTKEIRGEGGKVRDLV